MLKSVLLGSLLTILNLGIQVWAVVLVIRILDRRRKMHQLASTVRQSSQSLGIIMLFLFLGHLLQFATWATLFFALGEFPDFQTAFYHSAVNFTSLGYGDIVMSETWRLLGALEAANGVLMFGLTAGLVFAVMSEMFKHRPGHGDHDSPSQID